MTHWRRHDWEAAGYDDECATACGRNAYVNEVTREPKEADCPDCIEVWDALEYIRLNSFLRLRA